MKSVLSITLDTSKRLNEFHFSIIEFDKGNFQSIKSKPTINDTHSFTRGNINVMNIGSANNPIKSENLPVNSLPYSYFQNLSFRNKQIIPIANANVNNMSLFLPFIFLLACNFSLYATL